MPILEIAHVSKTFPGVKALTDVSLDINAGEVLGLVGENGAGKSTLIKILAGVYQPDEGAVIKIDGKEIGRMDPVTSVRHGIAISYQEFSLFSNLTVAENISMTKVMEEGAARVNWKQVNSLAIQILDRLGVDIDPNALLGSLSVASQQLVTIARALAGGARLIVLDEPTSALSSKEVQTLYKIVRDLRKDNVGVIFISHKLDEIFELCDRIVVLRDGKSVGVFNPAEITRDFLVAQMCGREVLIERKPHQGEIGEQILEVTRLSKRGHYKDIDFTLHKGEILGITGLVGAGRTELCESLFGLTQPDSGRIVIDQKQVELKAPADAIRNGVAYVPEDRLIHGLVLQKPVQDNIALTILSRLHSKTYLMDRDKKKRVADEWIARLNIKPNYAQMEAAKFSGGNQQRVVIAKWLATNPKVLIVDEPTNGVDIGAKGEIHDILRQLASQGLGILLISSELPEVLALSDRVLVMRKGRIAAEYRQVDNLTQQQVLDAALGN